MHRRARPAPATPKPITETVPESAPKISWSRTALDKRASDRAHVIKQAAAAAAFARERGVGAKAALATGLFKPATVMMVRNRMDGAVCRCQSTSPRFVRTSPYTTR